MITVQTGKHLQLIQSINWKVDLMTGTAFDSLEWGCLLSEQTKGVLCYSTMKGRVIYLSFERLSEYDSIEFRLIGMSSPVIKRLHSLLEKVHSALRQNNVEEAYSLIDYELYVKPEAES